MARRTVRVYILEPGTFRDPMLFENGDDLTSELFPDLLLSLAELFVRLE